MRRVIDETKLILAGLLLSLGVVGLYVLAVN